VLLFPSPHLFAQQVKGTIIQRVLVKVNGEVFTQRDLEDKQTEALQMTGRSNLQGDALTKAVTDLMPDLLVTAVDEMLLIQKGKELGFHMSNEQFTEMVDNIKKDNKMSNADFNEALRQEGLSLTQLREKLDRSYIIRTVQQKEIIGHMALTEEEARQYYDKHPDEFMKPPTVTIREILIAAADNRQGQTQVFGANTVEAARTKIEDIRQRALNGESFDKLAAEMSDSPTKTNGGLVGPINVSEMATGIRDAIEKLKPGEITTPIRTTRGYQIIQLEARSAAEPMPFDTLRDQIAQKIGESRLEGETQKYLQQLRAQAFIEWKRDDLRQMYEKRMAERAKL
jgi:peptidyl-prolyl cis-trans isomerase SurA